MYISVRDMPKKIEGNNNEYLWNNMIFNLTAKTSWSFWHRWLYVVTAMFCWLFAGPARTNVLKSRRTWQMSKINK